MREEFVIGKSTLRGAFAQVHGLDEFDAVINGFPLYHVGGTVTGGADRKWSGADAEQKKK